MLESKKFGGLYNEILQGNVLVSIAFCTYYYLLRLIAIWPLVPSLSSKQPLRPARRGVAKQSMYVPLDQML